MLVRLFRRLVPAIVWLGLLSAAALAVTTPSPKALRYFKKGMRAESKQQYDLAAQEFRRAIDADPAYTEAHVYFLEAYRSALVAKAKMPLPSDAASHEQTGGSPHPSEAALQRSHQAVDEALQQLLAIYQQWDKQYPNQAAIQWMIGGLTTKDKASKYYHKAIELDPGFTRAYIELGHIADADSNKVLSRDYYKQAVDSDPKDGRLQLLYAETFADNDLPKFRRLVEEIVSRFSTDPAGAKAVNTLAGYLTNRGDRIELYESMHKLYPPESDPRFLKLYSEAYREYFFTDPARAVASLQEQLKGKSSQAMRKYYERKLSYAQYLAQAQRLIDEGKFSEALAYLTNVKVFNAGSSTPTMLLRAKAIAGKDGVDAAYRVLANALAETPDEDLHAAFLGYAVKLERTPDDAETDVWKNRYAIAQPMKDFELSSYDGTTFTLSNMRGRIVLVNFFFPTCGGCIKELPYVQQLFRKYQSRGLAIVSINILPHQDKLIEPMFTKLGLRFPALEAPGELWASSNYNVLSVPDNMLVDQEGRMVLRIGGEGVWEQKQLDSAIETLLARTVTANATGVALRPK